MVAGLNPAGDANSAGKHTGCVARLPSVAEQGSIPSIRSSFQFRPRPVMVCEVTIVSVLGYCNMLRMIALPRRRPFPAHTIK